MKYLCSIPGIFLLLILVSLPSVSQDCKTTSKTCKVKLKPYQFSGEGLYEVQEGQSSELVAVLYNDEAYRLMYCAPDYWNNCTFNIYEKKTRKLVYTNKIDKDVPYWDIKPKTTQPYIIEFIVPFTGNDKTKARKSGCVGLLIGFK